jgi:hypothetical protein
MCVSTRRRKSTRQDKRHDWLFLLLRWPLLVRETNCPSPFSTVLDDIPRVLYYCSSWQNSDFMSLYDNLSTQRNGYQLVCCIRYVLDS